MFCPLAANRNCVAASRTWPMLPGRRLELDREDRLDRVDDDERRLEPRDLLEDALDAGFGQQVQRRGADAEAIAAALDLVLGLLARRVEHRADFAREVRGRLQQQRGLADAGLAAEQHQRPGHDAAAEHAIELADAGRQPHGVAPFRPPRTASPSSRRRTARSGSPLPRAAPASAARSSTSEFQAPHSAQRPIHFGACAPHSWQTKTDFGGFMHRDRPQGQGPGTGLIQASGTAILSAPDSQAYASHSAVRSACPSRQTISHGIVPIGRGHLARVDLLPASRRPAGRGCTTSSPGCTSSRPVTSTVIMSIDTAPTIGTRRPRISTWPRPAQARVEAVGVAGRNDGNRPRRVGREPPAVADALARPQALDRHDAAGQRHHRLQRDRRRQRRRHDAVEQQARAARRRTRRASRAAAPRCCTRDAASAVEPSAGSSRRDKLVDAAAPLRSARAASLNTGLSGTSADAKCV